MLTRVLKIDATHPDPAAIAEAADVLRRGELVAFPTETVYGLGANALDAKAVARIFEAKERPPNNPVIVHLPDAAAAREIAAEWPESAVRLATRFWPGPLTLVLPRAACVPDMVTAGGPTVGVRVPAHPVALALIRAAGMAIAAPSANRSTQLSPTRAEHVLRGLDGRIELLLDAGPTPGGLESTVLDLTASPPRLLRPGLVTPSEIESVVGPVQIIAMRGHTAGPARSPGLLHRHYAPRTPLVIVNADPSPTITALLASGCRVGLMSLGPAAAHESDVTVVAMPTSPKEYAAQLYRVLHALDDAGVDRIVVCLPPDTQDWLAVRDRLGRAAAS